MRLKIASLVLGTSLFLLSGCGSTLVRLKVNEIEKKQTVNLKLRSGEQVSGEVVAVDAGSLTILDKNNKAWRAQKGDVVSVIGPVPVYDANENIVSEREIAARMKNSNRMLFAVSGGLLCAGTSFFVSSMAARGAGEESRDAITIGGTSAGTLLGSLLFYRAGAKKDRKVAITAITGSNENPTIRAERIKQAKIQAELQRLKEERERQEQEMRELQEKIRQKENKGGPSNQ